MTSTTDTRPTATLLAAAKAAEEREHLARWSLPAGSGPIGYSDQARRSAVAAAKAETAAAWAALKERPDWEVVWSRRYAPENVAAAEARMRAGSEAQ